jgi:TetR/AcrR family transcriptional regulator, regulator of autoinduction and epiphytic fitness
MPRRTRWARSRLESRQTKAVEAHAPAPWLDPRIERSRRVVLEATVALIAESGYGAVTIEAVAARSGVAKSTIYRQWPNRLELINDAFHELKPSVPLPTGSTVRDRIVCFLEHVARNVGTSTWSACLPALIDAAEHDPDARELHSRLTQAGRQSLVDLLEEGVQSGELPAGLDLELMAEALVGPILIRRLMLHEAFDPSQVRHLVDQVLHLEREPAHDVV